MTDQPIEERCAAGRACAEVVDRLHAADTARALGELEQAERLRQAAARWGDAHGRGGSTSAGEQMAS